MTTPLKRRGSIYTARSVEMRNQLWSHAYHAEVAYRHGCPAAAQAYERAYARLKNYMQKKGAWSE
jgi:hypothetical protein